MLSASLRLPAEIAKAATGVGVVVVIVTTIALEMIDVADRVTGTAGRESNQVQIMLALAVVPETRCLWEVWTTSFVMTILPGISLNLV